LGHRKAPQVKTTAKQAPPKQKRLTLYSTQRSHATSDVCQNRAAHPNDTAAHTSNRCLRLPLLHLCSFFFLYKLLLCVRRYLSYIQAVYRPRLTPDATRVLTRCRAHGTQCHTCLARVCKLFVPTQTINFIESFRLKNASGTGRCTGSVARREARHEPRYSSPHFPFTP
jgi:hypothetical protein